MEHGLLLADEAVFLIALDGKLTPEIDSKQVKTVLMEYLELDSLGIPFFDDSVLRHIEALQSTRKGISELHKQLIMTIEEKEQLEKQVSGLKVELQIWKKYVFDTMISKRARTNRNTLNSKGTSNEDMNTAPNEPSDGSTCDKADIMVQVLQDPQDLTKTPRLGVDIALAQSIKEETSVYFSEQPGSEDANTVSSTNAEIAHKVNQVMGTMGMPSRADNISIGTPLSELCTELMDDNAKECTSGNVDSTIIVQQAADVSFLSESGNESSADPHLKCKLCDLQLFSFLTYRKHLARHAEQGITKNGKPRCYLCCRSFAHRRSLQRHFNTSHSEARPFGCFQCDKSFKIKQQLRVHQLVHSNVKAHVCNSCGKAYTQRSTLVKHQKTHSGIRPHKCTDCGASFYVKTDLRLHRVIHSDERPFSCQFCSTTFKVSKSLYGHLRHAHADQLPLKCSDCGLRCPDESYMARHRGRCKRTLVKRGEI